MTTTPGTNQFAQLVADAQAHMTTQQSKSATQQLPSVEAIEQHALDQLVDLYCNLREKLDPKLAELALETKELATVEVVLLETLDQYYELSEEGMRKTLTWLLQFSARGKQFQVLDKKKLIELLGLETFLELAEVSVTDLRKHLTAQALSEIGEGVYKNKRRLKYAKKGA